MINNVFIAKEGEKGLTLTSAAHLCAVASQVKQQAESVLNNVNFITTTVDVVGSNADAKTTSLGYTEEQFATIGNRLNVCIAMNRFISWFSEGRKVLEKYRRERHDIGLYEYAQEVGLTVPIAPEKVETPSSLTIDDAIEQMSVKDRETYLALEAKASVYGKFIHPDQPLEVARKKVYKALAEPYSTNGLGRDTLIYHTYPSIEPSLVDEEFMTLQAEYRKVEQQLNHMKSDLRNVLSKLTIEQENKHREALERYKSEYAEYELKYAELRSNYNEWRIKEDERVSKLRLAIPEALQETVTFLNNLDK